MMRAAAVLLLLAGAAAQRRAALPLDPAAAAPACSTLRERAAPEADRAATPTRKADAWHAIVVSGTLAIQSFAPHGDRPREALEPERVCGDVAIQQLRVGGASRPQTTSSMLGETSRSRKMPGVSHRARLLTRWRRSESTLRRRRPEGTGELPHRVACETRCCSSNTPSSVTPALGRGDYAGGRTGRRLRASRHAGL